MHGTLVPEPFSRRSLRWIWAHKIDFLPEVVLAAGLGLFTITEPRAAFSGLKSGKALFLIAVVSLGWLGARALTFLAVPWRAVRIAGFGLAALAILRVVVLPAYQNHTVVESLTASTPSTAAPPSTGPGATVVTPPAPPTEPVRLRTGTLRGIDHRASGAANIYRHPDGHLVVALEDFSIQPGPAYALYVVPGADRRDKGGGTRLERLRGNRGTQFYDVPATADVGTRPFTVLVWCETFGVPVASATPV